MVFMWRENWSLLDSQGIYSRIFLWWVCWIQDSIKLLNSVIAIFIYHVIFTEKLKLNSYKNGWKNQIYLLNHMTNFFTILGNGAKQSKWFHCNWSNSLIRQKYWKNRGVWNRGKHLRRAFFFCKSFIIGIWHGSECASELALSIQLMLNSAKKTQIKINLEKLLALAQNHLTDSVNGIFLRNR